MVGLSGLKFTGNIFKNPRRCRQSRCHYLDGGCLSSPRWTSLLVAEIFYPDTFLEENQGSSSGIASATRDPVAGSPPPVHDFQNYQQYLQKRASTGEARNNAGQQHYCDGVDEMGCFQVRELYPSFHLSYLAYALLWTFNTIDFSNRGHMFYKAQLRFQQLFLKYFFIFFPILFIYCLYGIDWYFFFRLIK